MEHGEHLIFENPKSGEVMVLNAHDVGHVRAVSDANQGGAIIEATGDFADGAVRVSMRFASIEDARRALEAGFSGPTDASELAERRAAAERDAADKKRAADEERRAAAAEKQANDKRSAERGVAADGAAGDPPPATPEPEPDTPEVVND